MSRLLSRRGFLRAGISASAMACVGLPCYGQAESINLHVFRRTISISRLPSAFRGTTIAFLTDLQHGPYVPMSYLREVVRTTAMLQADIIIFGGDYTSREASFIEPCFRALSELSAPMGVFGVMGDHDHVDGLQETRRAMKSAGINELSNAGVWLRRGGNRLRIAGVDDFWMAQPDLLAALDDAKSNDCCVLISHNPDFAETIVDQRVRLVLSGHTMGGQVVVPGIGPLLLSSRYGMKYSGGLVEARSTKVYVSVGVGVSAIPVRLNCPPEISLLTLV